jgi:site-specific recombinase XerD
MLYMKPLKSRYGSVKPYTRHQTNCPHKSQAKHNACHCPKWLYVRQKGVKARRYSLSTPSWVEAMSEATKLLEGMNPEVAAARQQKAEQRRKAVTISDAAETWLKRTQHEGSLRQYRSLMNGLVRYVDRWNLGEPEAERKVFIDQLDTRFCAEWYGSWKLSNSTMRQRWGVIRSFFAYLKEQGVIAENPAASIKAVAKSRVYLNGPYTDQQYNSIINSVRTLEDSVYRTRLHVFIELLRHTGMDVGDAVVFRPEMVDADGVLRYIRTKTGIQAVIPLSAHMVKSLWAIPLGSTSLRDMPFRSAGIPLESDTHNWWLRIKRVLKAAGVTKMQLVEKSGVPAYDKNGRPVMKGTNVKMFRHTFAVGWLAAGADKETVARMLGHVGTAMVDAHYAPWVKGLDDAHVRRVRALMGQAGKLKKGLKVVAKGGVEVAAASH